MRRAEGPGGGRALLLVQLLAFARDSAAGVGFCLDQVPAGLAETGYTAASTLTQAQCTAAQKEWCPLLDETKTFDYTDAASGVTTQIVYYWWSACCTGKQGITLIPDSGGLPTCKAGSTPTQCRRRHWQEKLEADLLGDDYNFQVAPGMAVTDPRVYGGVDPIKVLCKCKGSDPHCEMKGSGDTCLVCKTDEPCSQDNSAVSMSISFFKITSVDLRSSELDFSAWIRQLWVDPRLSYDYQCYGGLDYFEVQAAAGNLENGRIWVPDIELYNHKVPIWGDGVMGARLAVIYSCWDGAPTRGGCGEIFFSRPGVLTALCKYKGLLNFPNDQLSCELEFTAWAIDGRHQDLKPRAKDGGVNWIDKPVAEGETKSLAGLTAGSSFQDYRIGMADVTRKVTFYDCCPNSPYPTLLYKIIFERSASYYTFKLILPSITLSMLSFITFYMSPDTGERLGFGITMILAMLALDITASEMMPVCNEKTFMDYLSQVCMLFGCVSLVETGLVMFLHHQHSDDWDDALSPQGLFTLCEKFVVYFCRGKGKSDGENQATNKGTKSLVELGGEDDVKLRHQMYSQIFFVLDKDFGNSLDVEEISVFGSYAMGTDWSDSLAHGFLSKYDTNNDKALCLDEFALFCEEIIYIGKELKFIQERAKGFLEVVDRKEQKRVDMWANRAHKVDVVARWTIPTGFLMFICILYNMGEANLRSLAFDETGSRWQFAFYISGMMPTMCACVAALVLGFSKCPCCNPDPEEDEPNASHEPNPAPVVPQAAARGASEREPLTSRVDLERNEEPQTRKPRGDTPPKTSPAASPVPQRKAATRFPPVLPSTAQAPK